MIRIFVGTDQRQKRAERVLEHSIRSNTSHPVEITWMRAGDPGFDDWTGRPERPLLPNSPWATCFTLFRYAIPHLCEFEGRAIYLDSDMLVLADVAELWEKYYIVKGWHCVSRKRTDVAVIQCDLLKDRWPTLEDLKGTTETHWSVRQRVLTDEVLQPHLDVMWDCADHWTPRAKLVHYTNMQTQPWKPWPEYIDYQPHRDPVAEKLWHDHEKEAGEAADRG